MVDRLTAFALDPAAPRRYRNPPPGGQDRPSGNGAELSPRERDVLRLLAGGESNGQIAAALGLSINTVERHVSNLYRKIDARGRADATAWAVRRGLAYDRGASLTDFRHRSMTGLREDENAAEADDDGMTASHRLLPAPTDYLRDRGPGSIDAPPRRPNRRPQPTHGGHPLVPALGVLRHVGRSLRHGVRDSRRRPPDSPAGS